MLTHDLKAYDLPITRELLSSVRSAYSKYVADQQKKKADEKKAAKGRSFGRGGKTDRRNEQENIFVGGNDQRYVGNKGKWQFQAEDEGKLELLGTANGLKSGVEGEAGRTR